MSTLKFSKFRIGDPPTSAQGLRIGVTRRPPRGVPKERWVTDGYFDVWLPILGPSAELLATVKTLNLDDQRTRDKFFAKYERQLLANIDARQTIELIVQVARRMPVSIGCFCEDESRCHRSRLYDIILRQAGGK